MIILLAGGLATFTPSRRGLVSRRVQGTDSVQPGAYFGKINGI